MANLLLKDVQYRIEENFYGTWKRYLYPTGSRFTEFRTHTCFFGLPLLHFTFGVCPETGRRKVARGVIAIGRLAMGVLAFGQASLGVIALGQAGIGILALAQAGLGIFAIGQLAVALRFALGQLAIGYIAVGQFGYGHYVLAQIGFGGYVWSPKRADPVAVEYFRLFFQEVKEFFNRG